MQGAVPLASCWPRGMRPSWPGPTTENPAGGCCLPLVWGLRLPLGQDLTARLARMARRVQGWVPAWQGRPGAGLSLLSLCWPAPAGPASSASGTAVPMPGAGLARGRGLVDEQRVGKGGEETESSHSCPSGLGSFGSDPVLNSRRWDWTGGHQGLWVLGKSNWSWQNWRTRGHLPGRLGEVKS